jgi:hypothetical protein
MWSSLMISLIALMMEAARTSETSDNYFTRQYIPEDKSELQTCYHFARGLRFAVWIGLIQTDVFYRWLIEDRLAVDGSDDDR